MIRRNLTFANVASVVALFIAFGGASYAAFRLPADSVGTVQLRKNAVVSSKVKDRSLLARDFALGQIPSGPTGPAGPAGAQGQAGPQGLKGAPGGRGPSDAWIDYNPQQLSGGGSDFLDRIDPDPGLYLAYANTMVTNKAGSDVTLVC